MERRGCRDCAKSAATSPTVAAPRLCETAAVAATHPGRRVLAGPEDALAVAVEVQDLGREDAHAHAANADTNSNANADYDATNLTNTANTDATVADTNPSIDTDDTIQ